MEVKTIASFTIDHDLLEPGIYVSRIDGDVTTFDLRTRKPNCGDYMDNLTMHSLEHMFATFIRNSNIGGNVVYFGPMGCQTGFYLLVDGSKLDHQGAIWLMRQVCDLGALYQGEMPGKSEYECGNYRNLDVDLARELCAYYGQILSHWTVEKLQYESSCV